MFTRKKKMDKSLQEKLLSHIDKSLNKNSKMRNSEGFSLAEILVTIGLLSVVSLGVMRLTKNMNRSSNRFKQDFEAQQKIVKIQREINSSAVCEQSLAGVTLNGDATTTPIPNIKDTIGNDIAAPGLEFGTSTAGGLMHIESISIRGFKAADGSFGQTDGIHHFPSTTLVSGTPTAVQRGNAEVFIVFKKGLAANNPNVGGLFNPSADKATQSKGLGSLRFTRQVSIEVLTDNANTIIQCHGSEDLSNNAVCAALGGQVLNGVCHNLTIQNDATLLSPPSTSGGNQEAYAIQTIGNATIKPKGLGGAAYGSAPGSDAAGSFSVGVTGNANSISNLDVFGSAGIGAPNNGAPISDDITRGNLDVYNGVAIYGDGSTPQGLGVGITDPPAGRGNIELSGSLGVGGTAPVGNGNIRAAGAIQAVGRINSLLDIEAGGDLKAGGSLDVAGVGRFTGLVRAARFCIGSTNPLNCVTKARSQCPGRQVVVGFYNGNIACALDNPGDLDH
jgi:hypothetical protein